MATPHQASMYELMFGGSFKNFKPERLDATAQGSLGDNILFQDDASGRYGIKISGTAYLFAHLADLADFATETFVSNAISASETAIKGGVAADGDTLAKLRALIAALDSSKADQTTVSTIQTDLSAVQTDVAAINTLLQSDDINLDELQEIVTFIKANKNFLDNLSISNIAGLQASLDAKVAQADYDARVAAVDALIAAKVDQSVYDARVSAVDALIASKVSQADYDAGQAAQNTRLDTNEADILALQNLTASLQTSAVAYVDASVVAAGGTAVTGGYEYTASVPASKKIVGVTVECDGKSWGGYERTDEQNVKVFTPEAIGSSQFRFMLAYVPN